VVVVVVVAAREVASVVVVVSTSGATVVGKQIFTFKYWSVSPQKAVVTESSWVPRQLFTVRVVTWQVSFGSILPFPLISFVRQAILTVKMHG
jgi:hypothetical protein